MVKIIYDIIVPDGLDKIPAPTPEIVAYREEMVSWATDNGLFNISVNLVSPSEKITTYIWSSQTEVDEFYSHFGQGYIEYYAGFVNQVQTVGGTVTRTVESI